MPYKNVEDEREHRKRRHAALSPEARRELSLKKYRQRSQKTLEKERTYSRHRLASLPPKERTEYKKRQKAWLASNPDKKRLYTLRTRLKPYLLTPESYQAIVDKQGGTCAICKRIPKRFVIDHDHITMRIRAVLCDRCNMLMSFVDEPDFELFLARAKKLLVECV